MDFINILDFFYPSLSMGIVLVTYIVKQAIKTTHPKWITLAVAALEGIIHFFVYQETEVWKVVNSLGIAIIFYDYIVKAAMDTFQAKNPFKNEPKS